MLKLKKHTLLKSPRKVLDLFDLDPKKTDKFGVNINLTFFSYTKTEFLKLNVLQILFLLLYGNQPVLLEI